MRQPFSPAHHLVFHHRNVSGWPAESDAPKLQEKSCNFW
jgi:hypothetical protein